MRAYYTLYNTFSHFRTVVLFSNEKQEVGIYQFIISTIFETRKKLAIIQTILSSVNLAIGSAADILILFSGSQLLLNGEVDAGLVLTILFLANLSERVSC